MAATYLLDTGPLGLLAHGRPSRRKPIQDRLTQELANGATVYISEVADYEVRRELVRLVRASQLPASRIDRLDRLSSVCGYLPVSTSMWKRAAELWAEARATGLPTAADPALDADVLLASQALDVSAIVVTKNPGHIGRWVPVETWS